MDTPRRFRCQHALLPDGWAEAVVFDLAADGSIANVATGDPGHGLPTLGQWIVPGMPNLHSHAFQRAMAGAAECRSGAPNDDFWSWREAMYQLAGRLSPDSLQAIAAQVYAEMLAAGYTSVCEFHYVHQRADGSPYAPASAMADALRAAARDTGIGLTLLPALYQTGGFDGRPLVPRQQRFGHRVEDFVALVEALRRLQDGQLAVGIAVHSLRAVPADALAALLGAEVAATGPLHIHVAEQLAEVDDCLQQRAMRPVAWLLAHAAVDARWCLVHATHMADDERRALAASGAVAGLCPTTEANLGDGLFALREWLDLGAGFGIGSDSQISVSPVEELRWLEYGQRLRHLRRNVLTSASMPSSGELLWQGALRGGAQACGRAVGALAPGRRADFLVLDEHAPEFAGRQLWQLLETLVFAGNRNLVREVYVGGRRVAEMGRHMDARRIGASYRACLEAAGHA